MPLSPQVFFANLNISAYMRFDIFYLTLLIVNKNVLSFLVILRLWFFFAYLHFYFKFSPGCLQCWQNFLYYPFPGWPVDALRTVIPMWCLLNVIYKEPSLTCHWWVLTHIEFLIVKTKRWIDYRTRLRTILCWGNRHCEEFSIFDLQEFYQISRVSNQLR